MRDAADPEVDLTPEQRARIDAAYRELEAADHYRILGLSPGADLASIKRAYRDQVREFHPDRFFRKQLGAYHARMVAVLTRIEAAYDVLRSPVTRAAYDAEHGFAAPPPRVAPLPRGEPTATEQSAKQDQRKAEALEALRKQVEARRAQARELAAQGARAAAQGDVTGAAEAYRRAAALTPGDPAARAAHESAQRAVDARATDALSKQADFQERAGHWAEAARTWQRVLAARPDDDSARARLDAALVNASRASTDRGGRA